MSEPFVPMAISYDFDSTLAPGNMQERDFIPAVGMTKEAFWAEIGRLTKEHGADPAVVYLYQMIQKAAAVGLSITRDELKKFGEKISFFPGLVHEDGMPTWFDRINAYGAEKGVDVRHFVISSGIREMIEGTKIAPSFQNIFASSFMYDCYGRPIWPALVVNYTTKTQFLFRINKGILDVTDQQVNAPMEKAKRPVPFSNMMFIGDGDTDVPSFSLLNSEGGTSVAVYEPQGDEQQKRATRLYNEKRVGFVAPADYREGKSLEGVVKSVIDKISAQRLNAPLVG